MGTHMQGMHEEDLCRENQQGHSETRVDEEDLSKENQQGHRETSESQVIQAQPKTKTGTAKVGACKQRLESTGVDNGDMSMSSQKQIGATKNITTESSNLVSTLQKNRGKQSSIPTLPRPENPVAFTSTTPAYRGTRMVQGKARQVHNIEGLSDKEREEFGKRREEADKEIQRVKAKMAGTLADQKQQEQEKEGPKLRSTSKVNVKRK